MVPWIKWFKPGGFVIIRTCRGGNGCLPGIGGGAQGIARRHIRQKSQTWDIWYTQIPDSQAGFDFAINARWLRIGVIEFYVTGQDAALPIGDGKQLEWLGSRQLEWKSGFKLVQLGQGCFGFGLAKTILKKPT